MRLNIEFIRETGYGKWAWRTLYRQISKRVLHRDNSIVLPTGLKMWLPAQSRFSSEVFITRCKVDWGSEVLLAQSISSMGVFLDVGANAGYYSLYMLPCANAVHAFEPDPRALEILKRNLSPYPNAHIHGIALGNQAGRRKLLLGESSETSTLGSSGDQAGNSVEVSTIDDFVAANNLSVSGMKIDVEGADLEVLEGAVRTLETQQPVVLTESDPSIRLFSFVGPLNYKIFAFTKSAPQKGFRFAELHPDPPQRTKMLFLVPPNLQSKFSKLAKQK